jgi:hypothetical protein
MFRVDRGIGDGIGLLTGFSRAVVNRFARAGQPGARWMRYVTVRNY